jgi:hypothetical protein
VDEDYVSAGTSCGVGACSATGSTSCVSGTVVDSCVPGTPSIEVCSDSIDNDCDGSIDEGCLASVPGEVTELLQAASDPNFTRSPSQVHAVKSVEAHRKP